MPQPAVVHPPAPHSLPAADGLRGLACLQVLLVHAFSLFYPALFPLLRGSGKYGVWLFFVLSAFLLSLRLQQHGLRRQALLDYALGRSLRILPAYWLACLLYAACGIGISSPQALWQAVSLQAGFIHLWTIPVEFIFYALLPPLLAAALCLRRRGGWPLLLGGSGLAVALQQYIWPYAATPENAAQPTWYLATFTSGLLAALALPWRQRYRAGLLATAYALVCITVLLLALPGSRQVLLGTPLSNDLSDKHLYLGLLWAGAVLLLVTGEGLIGRWLQQRWLVQLGRISYSTYLFHWLIFSLLASHWPQQPLVLLLAMALAVLAGWLGFYLLEQPMERLRSRYSPLNRQA